MGNSVLTDTAFIAKRIGFRAPDGVGHGWEMRVKRFPSFLMH